MHRKPVQINVGDIIEPYSADMPIAVWNMPKDNALFARVFQTRSGPKASTDYRGYKRKGMVVVVDRRPKHYEKIKVTAIFRDFAQGVVQAKEVPQPKTPRFLGNARR